MLKVKGDKVEIGKDAVRCLSIVDYTWEVTNFTELKMNKSISSQIFHGNSKSEKWQLRAKLVAEADIRKYFEIELHLVESESVEAVNADYQYSYLNAENKVIHAGKHRTGEFLVGTGCFAKHFRPVTNPSAFLIDGSSLRIHVQLSTQTTLNLNLKRKRDDDEESLVKKQFKSFFTNGDFADVILKTENNSFPACKVILAAHSPVFSAMFSSGMIESTKNVVTIEDCSDEAVKSLLEFMYTGETPMLEENPMDLLKIGDKYQVMELQKKAEAVILKSLTIQNAVEILILAYFHSPTTLKPKVMAFVNKNSKDIKQTPEFKEMGRKFPEIFFDLYDELSSAEKMDTS